MVRVIKIVRGPWLDVTEALVEVPTANFEAVDATELESANAR